MAGSWTQPLEEVLAMVPQQRPFRFVDHLTRLDDKGAEGGYRFRSDEGFYAGHFPGMPITPGVILIEAMAQVAVVAHGIYLLGLERPREEVALYRAVFTEGEQEFHHIVRPGDEIEVRSELVFFRRMKIRARAELRLGDGRVAATATLSGIGVRSEAA